MWPSHWELLVVFLVILLLFGAKRIPEMARGLGKGIREFRSAVKDVQDEVTTTSRAPAESLRPSAPPAQVARTADSGGQAAPPAPAEEGQKEARG